MLDSQIGILSITAASIGFFHTLLGPDHYIPFIVLGKSGNWSLKKTLFITFLCGLGHVLSSVAMGIIGIAIGIAISSIEFFESFRGEIAAWFLISFGIIYFLWGIKKSFKKDHDHRHQALEKKQKLTPWILFIIFVLGPCEPLIPILMYPSAKSSITGLIIVTSIFALTTILTMVSVVFLSTFGLKSLSFPKLEKHSHSIAGATILLSGLGIKFLGL